MLEDKFPSGRPALEKVGVTFVEDVSPWERMKIRILNGGHAIIAYPAGLLDIHFVHEAMEHELIRGYLGKIERDEIIPAVPPIPGTDLDHYYRLIERRFANPKIGDTVRRLCLDGSDRQPKFILPTVRDRRAAGQPSAAWRSPPRSGAATAPARRTAARPFLPTIPSGTASSRSHCRRKAIPPPGSRMGDIYGELADGRSLSSKHSPMR